MGVTLAVLTSGGDAQGMNPTVRAVVRSALHHGAEVHAVYEGYQGLVDGGDRIRHVAWDDVGYILTRGGTVLGTARSAEFRDRAGRRRAAANLVARGIDRLVVIGGDGSLSGADVLRAEWPSLLAELVGAGELDQETADRHPVLALVGLVGSIDNDMVGTETTIGADSALHRIVEALDAIGSTASSHQRSFVVEVMGRRCGYLALAAALAAGADYVLIPERPPQPGWEDDLCELVRAGRVAGRRNSVVVVAEGAHDSANQPITSAYVRTVLEERLGEDTRVTILGHVQRGGVPSAYDRWMSAILGSAAVEELLAATPETVPPLVGVRGNRVHTVPLHEAVTRTRELADRITARDFDTAQKMRGDGFTEMVQLFESLSRALPDTDRDSSPRSRIAVLNVGGLAPGMNAAARAAVRLGLHRGHTMLGVDGSFRGLVAGDVRELAWGDVSDWTGAGGAELGISRDVPAVEDLYAIGRGLERHGVDGLLIVGGWDAFASAGTLRAERHRYPAFQIPTIVLPATIDNNIPTSEMSVGADTALNHVVSSIDRIRETSAATRRCFVVETMGGYCGYLALMSGLSGGAVRVYLHEEGVTLSRLAADVEQMVDSFAAGQRLFLAVRNERASEMYTSDFLRRIFEQEGRGTFDARQIVLGQTQQGGSPSPFDRILAARLAARAVAWLGDEMAAGSAASAVIGLHEDGVRIVPLQRAEELADREHRRPTDQWWMRLRPTVDMLAARTAAGPGV
ncbi:6-phosphofructokinase [Pseudonocardia charpentierae]|uniref:6-phosphofructokinase n=1 Tax=Pseudonocardia charpentierae TaxID=3075545 RepID=A0ABU2N5L4_9PSEU|nr:6-phosphofructokinase [Pseudonocardia sp. DSM 45834]MDT0349217.1 6-phosphofructokinase [Pseudonocardia sp. DSM 45834]